MKDKITFKFQVSFRLKEVWVYFILFIYLFIFSFNLVREGFIELTVEDLLECLGRLFSRGQATVPCWQLPTPWVVRSHPQRPRDAPHLVQAPHCVAEAWWTNRSIQGKGWILQPRKEATNNTTLTVLDQKSSFVPSNDIQISEPNSTIVSTGEDNETTFKVMRACSRKVMLC
jgi:hypothetical protein